MSDACPGTASSPCSVTKRDSNRLPSRGICRHCGKDVALTIAGNLRQHKGVIDPCEYKGEDEFARKYATGKHFQLTIQEAGKQRGRVPYTRSVSCTSDELMSEMSHLLTTINMDTTLTIKRNK